MIEATVKELMHDQKKRFARLKQKEQDNRTTEDAKVSFHRKPYMGIYGRHDQSGNGDSVQ